MSRRDTPINRREMMMRKELDNRKYHCYFTMESAGGMLKDSLRIIEEIIRLISHGFQQLFASLSSSFAGANIFSQNALLSSPPSLAPSPQRGVGQPALDHLSSQYCDQSAPSATAYCSLITAYRSPSSPGPGNWIQTRCRILEILLKLKSILSKPNQVPYFGSNLKSHLVRNSFLHKAFITSFDAITTGTERLFTPLSLIECTVPRLGGYITLCGLIAFGGALAIPTSAEAATGDRIAAVNISYGQSTEIAGGAYDNVNDKLYFIDNKDQKIYSRDAPGWSDASQTLITNLEAGDEYFGLGFGRISGTPYLAAANVTDCELEIYNALTGAQVNSKTMPGSPGGPAGPKGVTFGGSNWDVIIYQAPRIMNQYDGITLNLQRTVNLSDNGLNIKNTGLTFDSNRNLFYVIQNGEAGFYTFRISGNDATDVNFFTFEPAGAAGDFKGAAFREGPLELVMLDDWSISDIIDRYEGYDAPPTPTPSPSPAPTPPILILDSGDFSGNGTSDISIFRASSGLWAIRGVTRVYFGSSSDIPAAGDYDGDGTSDIGIFRPSSGLWAIKGVTRSYFGSASDIPVPGDYDRDGLCEPGIFRKSSGLWAIRGVTRAYFGGSSDRPVPGYFRAKSGKDIAIFRPSSGLWAIRGVTRAYFGSYADWPVPADYAGSTVEDISLFRPHSGLWAIKGVSRTYFGGASDRPVPADFAGSGTAAIGIFRETSGLWAVRGVTRVYFGGDGDIPIAGPLCRPLTPTPSIAPTATPTPTVMATATMTPTSIPTITPTPTPE
jgi:hypothetical protein